MTGASGMARITGLGAFTGLAVLLYLLLVTAWAVAGHRTVRGALSGRLAWSP